MALLETPIINANIVYVNGLSLTYISPTSFSVSPGAARDSTDRNDIILSSTVTLDATKVGANGIDNGVIAASSMYAVYAIADSTAYKATAALISLNYIQPNLPFGYDMFRRIGWVATNPSATIIKFFQYGSDDTRTYEYDPDDEDTDGTKVLNAGVALTFTPVSLSPVVPPIATLVGGKVEYNQAHSADLVQFSPFGSVTVNGLVFISGGTIALEYFQVTIPTQLDASGHSSFVYKVSTDDSVSFVVKSYEDYLS